MKIGVSIIEVFDDLFAFFGELTTLSRRIKSNKIRVKIIKENMDIETYRGMLSDNRRFLYVYELDRLIIEPLILREGSRNIAYLPENSHGGLDFNNIKNVAKAQKYKILLKWRRLKNWEKTDIKYVDSKEYSQEVKAIKESDTPYCEVISTGSIDFNLFNNNVSPMFAGHCFQVSQANVLNFLKDLPNWKLIGTAIAGILFGFILGAGCMFIFNMMYNAVT